MLHGQLDNVQASDVSIHPHVHLGRSMTQAGQVLSTTGYKLVHKAICPMKLIKPTCLLLCLAALAHGQDLDAQAQAIVDKMSVDQLIGQMTQVNIDYIMTSSKTVDTAKVQNLANQFVGSILNTPIQDDTNNVYSVSQWRDALNAIQNINAKQYGRPIVYGLDSVHGANYVKDAVLFPQQINIGATFNPTFATSMGKIAARDTKAGGMNWLFTPILDVSRHKGWPRTYETYGEDPLVASTMATNIVQGIQGQGVAACFKHFMGYSASQSGKDRDPVTLSKHEIQNIFMPPFKAAVDAGVMTGMGSYIQLNGVPMSANRQTSIDLLRNDLKWDGMLVSDWAEMYLQNDPYHWASSNSDAVLKSMTNSSYDMCMVPDDTSFITYLKDHYNNGRVSLDRIKTSAKRVIKLKLKLDLYNNPVPGADLVSQVGDKASQQAALAAAQESLVLVKNTNNILPLNPASKKFFLTGSSIDDMGYLCGGWSLRWQGRPGNEIFPKYGRTIKGAASAYINDASRTLFYHGVNIDGTWTDINTAKNYASQADYTIVAIGERTYAEQNGNTDPYELPSGMTDYVKQLATTGTKIILVLVEGRPRLLSGIAELASAVVYAGLPCELGGEAIADLLFGKINPSGKMTLTYPKSNDQLNMYTAYYGRRGDKCVVNGVESSCPYEWQFGHGLSYTTFSYTNMQLSATALSPTNNQVTVSVTVANTGSMTGKESVLLFVRAPNGPETRLLKAFTKVELTPGQSTVVSFKLTSDDFGRYVNEIGAGLSKAADAGTYYVSFKASVECSASTVGDLCKLFTWTPPGNPPTSSPTQAPTSAPPAPATGAYNLNFDGFGLTLSNTANDALSVTTPAPGDARQEWYYTPSLKQFKNRGSGLCLDAWQPTNGGGVHAYACDTTNANQLWNYDSSTKQLRHATHSGFCFDKGAPTDTAPHMWECLATTHPDYKNQHLSAAVTSVDRVINSPAYNRVLTGVDASTIQFQPLSSTYGDSQKWRFDASTKMIRSVGRNTCLDAWEPKDDGGVHLYGCDTTNGNQRWNYDSTTLQLRHASLVGYCLDIATPAGDKPHMWSCLPAGHADIKNQQFTLN
ncbi:hypothetical protein LEN26_011091 [Aphanomyces euteiches]|nr:hypothetical protein LEN26_011091 [Aphanomyces euteiches]